MCGGGAEQRRNLWWLVEREGSVAGVVLRCRMPVEFLLGVMESRGKVVAAPLARRIERGMGMPEGWLDGEVKCNVFVNSGFHGRAVG